MDIPKGFEVINSNDSLITFNDGKYNITLFIFQDISVKDSVKKYVDSINEKVVVENVTLFGKKLTRKRLTRTTLHVGNSTYINYWFGKKNSTYRYHIEFKNNADYSIREINLSVLSLINQIK